MSPAQRAYSRLKQLLNTGDKLPPDFSVVRASGPEAPQVFARASGKPLTQGISSLFTYDGYHGLFLHELPKVTTLGSSCRKRRSEEHTSELQSQSNIVCRLLLEKKKNKTHVSATST